MAELIFTPSGADGFVNEFERQVVRELCRSLPADWKVAANFTFKPRNGHALEVDALVFASSAIFVVEAKGWSGRVVGDDQQWETGMYSVRCPLILVNQKSKVLASMFREQKVADNTIPLLVVPDDLELLVDGNWARHAVHLREMVAWMMENDEGGGRKGEAPEKAAGRMRRALEFLQGRWEVRNRSERRRVGPYEVLETLERDEQGGVYLAKHAQFDEDASRYRIRTWRVAPTAEVDGTDRQLRWMVRSAEARQRVGLHENVLGVLFFEHDPVETEFVEVTPWPPGGSLHRYLMSSECAAAPLAARLGIAVGIAEALKALHAAGVVHRNVQPKAILLTENWTPKLTDFERAHLDGETTVYSDSRGRTETAYLAPELFLPTTVDSSPAADCYALGVILYQLLTGELPFVDPHAAAEAGGLPKRLPSAWVKGLDPRLDELVVSLLHTGKNKIRPTADEAVRRLRELLQPAAPKAEVAAGGMQPAVARPAAGFVPGTILDGRWRIDARLGSGGFAQVFRVHHLNQGVDYAMKIFVGLADSELALNEFNQVRPRMPVHPNLRQIVWLDRLNEPYGNIYMVAELITGATLEPWTRGERSMEWSQKREVAAGLLSALAAIHGAGVIHRDVKPANIVVEEKTGRALLIDFNVASAEPNSDELFGTRRYRPADVVRVGWGAHADLYSLAVVLFELFFGEHPLTDVAPGEPARSPRSVIGFAGVSDATVAFFAKALDARAEQRFRRASEMLAALPEDLFAAAAAREEVPKPAAPALPAAQPAPTEPEGRKGEPAAEEAVSASEPGWLRRNMLWVLSAVLLPVLAVGAGFAWLVRGERREPPPPPVAAPAPKVAAVSPFDHRGCPNGFVRVPAGRFRMGKESWEKSGYKDELPAHDVTIGRDFCMQQHETRQREWSEVMGHNPSVHSGCGGDCPVDSVTWREAVAFANARSAAEQRPSCYQGDALAGLTCGGYRLPTEAEWEYAARADEDRGAPVTLEAIAWFKGNANGAPHPVGGLKPNRWGLYDMLGNVWEWTSDRYGPYASEAVVDPLGADRGSIRVRRGGAWNSFPMIARVGNRGNSLSQSDAFHTTGLRLVVLPRD